MTAHAATLDLSIWGTGAAILALLLLAAVLSAAETALDAASRLRLRALAEAGDRGAAAALALTAMPERVTGALLLGTNIVCILSAALATALLTRLFGESGIAVASFAMVVVLLTFAQVLPRSYAIGNPDAVAARLARPVRGLIVILWPVVALVRSLTRAILRAFGVEDDPGRPIFRLREDIAEALAEGHSAGTLPKDDRDRMMGLLDLGDRTVEEVMRHRSQVAMIDADAAPAAIVQAVLASPHTRLPMFRGERENIIGVLHAKDLLRAVDRTMRAEDAGPEALRALDVAALAMKPYFIPETTPLDEQMRAFTTRRGHVALVVDEYGAWRGLITLEDILEEIVGEITDEFDVDAQHPLKRGTGAEVVVDGAMSIRDLNRAMDWALPDDEANTIAGLMIHEAQLIPAEGQVFSFHGLRFEVLARKENRITRLRLRPL